MTNLLTALLQHIHVYYVRFKKKKKNPLFKLNSAIKFNVYSRHGHLYNAT